MNTPMSDSWILRFVLMANAMGILCSVESAPSGATQISLGTSFHREIDFYYEEKHENKDIKTLCKAHAARFFEKNIECI